MPKSQPTSKKISGIFSYKAKDHGNRLILEIDPIQSVLTTYNYRNETDFKLQIKSTKNIKFLGTIATNDMRHCFLHDNFNGIDTPLGVQEAHVHNQMNVRPTPELFKELFQAFRTDHYFNSQVETEVFENYREFYTKIFPTLKGPASDTYKPMSDYLYHECSGWKKVPGLGDGQFNIPQATDWLHANVPSFNQSSRETTANYLQAITAPLPQSPLLSANSAMAVGVVMLIVFISFLIGYCARVLDQVEPVAQPPQMPNAPPNPQNLATTAPAG